MIVGTHVHEGDAAAMWRQRSAMAALLRLPGVEAVNWRLRATLVAAPGTR
jgi:hypothetical protein